MALAEEPIASKLTRAIVAGLEETRTDEAKWRNPPLTIRAGITADMLEDVRPLVAIQHDQTTANPQGYLGAFDDELTFEVACLSRGGANAYYELQDLIADVRQWFRENFRGLDGLVDSGWMFEFGYHSGIQGIQGGAGDGMGTIVLKIKVETTSATP